MCTRFAIVLKLVLAALVALAPAAQAQDALIPYFRFSFGTLPKTVGVPAANTNTDPSTGLAVSVPCLTCTGRRGAYMSFEPAVYNVPPGNTVTWFLASGTLPDGMDLSPATGVVFGTAGFTEPTKFVLGVQDDRQVPVYTPEITFQAFKAVSVSYASTAGRPLRPIDLAPQTAYVFGTPVYTLESGYFPDGVTLDRNTGHISGTVGSSSFGIQVRATDSDGGFGISPPFDIVTDAPQVIYPASPYSLRTGVAASEVPNIINMVQPYTAVLTGGTLPPGLKLSQATGVIDGNPTQAGTWPNVVVTVTDSRGTVKSGDPLTFNVAQPAVTYASGSTRVNRFYAANPTPQALSSPQYYLTSGSLPAGMTINQATGAIQGYPTAVGTFSNLAVTAVDGAAATATSPAFSIAVANQPSVNASSILGRVNTQLSMQPTYADFPSAPTWALSGPALPQGLSFNPATGRIAGTVAAPFSATGYVLTATLGDLSAYTAPFSISVASPLKMTGSTGFLVHESTSQSRTMTVTGSLADPSTLTLQKSANTPSWITTNGLTVTASPPAGIGSTTANYGFTVTDSDGTQASVTTAITTVPPLRLTVNQGPGQGQELVFSNGISTSYYAGRYDSNIGSVQATLLQNGVPAPNALDACQGITWNPNAANNSTTVSGVSTAACSIPNLSIVYTDSYDATTTVSATFTVTGLLPVKIAAPTTLRIPANTPATLPITVSGGKAPLKTSLISGSAPVGMTYDPNTNAFTGTPTLVGQYSNLVVQAVDARGVRASTPAFAIVVAPQLVIANPTPSYAVTAGSYNQMYMAISGGTAPFTTKVVQGTLPPEAQLVNTQYITTNDKMYPGEAYRGIVVQVTDSMGLTDTTDPFDIVAVAPVAVPTSTDSPAGNLNQPFRMAFTTSGGVGPYTFSWGNNTAANAAKGGFSISPDGVITGQSATATQAVVSVQATDARGLSAKTANFTVSITGPLTATVPQYVPMYYPGSGVKNTVKASGGATPYSYAVAPGYTVPKTYFLDYTNGAVSWQAYSNGWKGAFVVTDASGRTATTSEVEFVAASELKHSWPAETRSSPTGTGGSLTTGGVTTVWDIATYRPQVRSAQDNARPPYVGVSGGRPPYRFDFTGTTVPSDILVGVDSVNGKLTLRPRTGWSGVNMTGVFQVTITDTSGQSIVSRTQTYQNAQPVIQNCGAVYSVPTVVLIPCVSNNVNVAYGAINLTQEGNTWSTAKSAWQWTLRGGPPGLDIYDMGRNNGTGIMCGAIPNSAIGSYTATVQTTDPNGSQSAACNIYINVHHY